MWGMFDIDIVGPKTYAEGVTFLHGLSLFVFPRGDGGGAWGDGLVPGLGPTMLLLLKHLHGEREPKNNKQQKTTKK